MAQDIGYPVVVRPSYVLGGRAMEIVQNATEIIRYLTVATEAGQGRPVLIDKYMEGRECEVDAICDGHEVLIPGIMEHIERAGVHSGDSMAVYPGLNLTPEEVDTMVDYTTRIGLALNVSGLIKRTVRYPGRSALQESPYSPGRIPPILPYMSLRSTPRASRTIPFISKVTGLPVVNLATRVMLGRTLKDMGHSGGLVEETENRGHKGPRILHVPSSPALTGTWDRR